MQRENVADEHDIDPARERAAEDDVCDPILVRSSRGEVTHDQIRTKVWAVASECAPPDLLSADPA